MVETAPVCLAPRTPPTVVNQEADRVMLVAYREPGITRFTSSSSSNFKAFFVEALSIPHLSQALLYIDSL